MSMYRIREARVEVCNGFRCWKERRFIAERRVVVTNFLFLKLGFWWPVANSNWQEFEERARDDIEADMRLRHHLTVRYFDAQP